MGKICYDFFYFFSASKTEKTKSFGQQEIGLPTSRSLFGLPFAWITMSETGTSLIIIATWDFGALWMELN